MTQPTIKILLALLSLALMTGAALAQQRKIYDSRGNVAGRSSTDSQGSMTNANTTTIYNAGGRNVGRVTTVLEIGHCRFKVEDGMKERIDRHKDGSVKAKGHMKDGELEGYWEWFRLDGSKLRSGHFKRGKQVANGPPMTPLARS